MPGHEGRPLGEPLNSSAEPTQADSSSSSLSPAALCQDLAAATGIPAAKTRRQNVCRVVLVGLAASFLIVHVALLSSIVHSNRKDGVSLADISSWDATPCLITGDDACACDLGHKCTHPDEGPNRCSCGEGHCCSVASEEQLCYTASMPGSYMWKVQYALHNGCVPPPGFAAPAQTAELSTDNSKFFGEIFLCPASMQREDPPKIDQIHTLPMGVRIEPMGGKRGMGECHIPQTPHMVGVDTMPPLTRMP